MNFQSLANDVGIGAKTIKQWLSILEASFVIFKLSPYFENFGKRVIKSPKYYFIDIGLLSYLLDIDKPSPITRDPLISSLFENLVILDLLKTRYNQGLIEGLYFFRDSNGNEVDLLFKRGGNLIGVEIKSASTWHHSFIRGLSRFSKFNQQLASSFVVYNGKPLDLSDGTQLISYRSVVQLG